MHVPFNFLEDLLPPFPLFFFFFVSFALSPFILAGISILTSVSYSEHLTIIHTSLVHEIELPVFTICTRLSQLIVHKMCCYLLHPSLSRLRMRERTGTQILSTLKVWHDYFSHSTSPSPFHYNNNSSLPHSSLFLPHFPHSIVSPHLSTWSS